MVNRAATSRWTTKRAVSGAESATFTPGISERRGSASRFYHGDIKNFVEQTDSSGQIVSSQQYDAFGNPVSSTGAWSGPFAYGGRFGYQSDSDTSLSLLGHRYYDSTTGRFLSRDPVGDGRNWYGYCGNNPVAFADPSGLFLLEVGAALLAITVLTVTIVKLGNMASDAREENREGEDAFQRKVEEQGLESVPVEEIDRTYRPDRKAIEEVRNEAMEELKDQYLLGPIEALHPGVEAVSNAIKLLRELLDAWRTPDPPIIDRY